MFTELLNHSCPVSEFTDAHPNYIEFEIYFERKSIKPKRNNLNFFQKDTLKKLS